MKQSLAQISAHLQNLLYPPRCGSCHDFVEQQGGICQSCWKELQFLTAPFCHACGYPFEYQMDEEALCAACMQHYPEFDAHRAAMVFDENSKHLIHQLKYYDQPLMLPQMARWLKQSSREFLTEDNLLIIPVPLHWKRLLKRKYNQSGLLAKALAKETGLPLHHRALKRIKSRAPQASLSRKDRLQNAKGVFAINPRFNRSIAEKNILLVDDVMTTGATLNACAKALKKAGAKQVFAVTLARTVLD